MEILDEDRQDSVSGSNGSINPLRRSKNARNPTSNTIRGQRQGAELVEQLPAVAPLGKGRGGRAAGTSGSRLRSRKVLGERGSEPRPTEARSTCAKEPGTTGGPSAKRKSQAVPQAKTGSAKGASDIPRKALQPVPALSNKKRLGNSPGKEDGTGELDDRARPPRGDAAAETRRGSKHRRRGGRPVSHQRREPPTSGEGQEGRLRIGAGRRLGI